MRHLGLALATTAVLLHSCGRDEKSEDGGVSSGPLAQLGDATAAPESVKVCKPVALALQSTVTYSGNLYPTTQKSCAQCHRGDIENRQNSTNCYYMKDHLANLIARLDNAVAAAAFKVANPAATNNEITNMYTEDDRPMPPVGRPPLTAAEIDDFRNWAAVANKCGEGDPIPEDEVLATPAHYSSDEDESSHQSLEKIFESATCTDGPSINTEANWAAVTPVLALEPNPPSAFYDYVAKDYVAGATAATHECSFDGFIASLDAENVTGVEKTLRDYQGYGWRMTQCAVVDGLPLASMATLSAVINSLGDTILGVNFKTIKFGAKE